MNNTILQSVNQLVKLPNYSATKITPISITFSPINGNHRIIRLEINDDGIVLSPASCEITVSNQDVMNYYIAIGTLCGVLFGDLEKMLIDWKKNVL